MKGDRNALSPAAREGLELFVGEAGCVRCHNGPLLSDGKYYRLGIGRTDLGREKITGAKEDRFRFRTPSLRDIARTGPYMHDGSLKTLQEVVEFYYRGAPERPSDGVEWDIEPLLGGSYSDIPLIVAFLKSLSGELPVVEIPDTQVQRAATRVVPDSLTMRVRLAAIDPPEPSVVRWRYGGEGKGGEVHRGRFLRPGVSADRPDEDHRLDVGQWSAPLPLHTLADRWPKRLFLTVTAGRPGRVIDRETRRRGEYSTGVVFEFEYRDGSEVLKRLTVNGPDGGTATLVIPVYRLAESGTPRSAEFLNELTGVLEYARRRADMLESLPWAGGPLPKKYALVNNVGGYGVGYGYGIRTTDRQVTLAEMRSLRQLGVNGFRTPPDFVLEQMMRGGEMARQWNRVMMEPVMGFPVPTARGRPNDPPDAGCPSADSVHDRTAEQVAESLEKVSSLPVDEVWGLTVDEIGSVFDRSPEKKAHLAACAQCAAAFRAWLAEQGYAPADFGSRRWADVYPLNVWDAASDREWLTDPGKALAAYATRDFNNIATARLFTALRDAFAAQNQAKRDAIARGDLNSPAACRPWLYSYALRGNTFLMKGHSLDFFDFYRYADNAIVYETSNRDPRIWSWDSYLCDVQRVVGREFGLAQGIYIKPHRGAPLQRMLSAVSRGDTMIYWYTYGPDYKKGDSFSQDETALRLTSKAAHLLGKAEDALYGSQWAVPAEIAVVKPETTQRWMNLSGNTPALVAAWENAKWVYTALQHAHLPVDPIGERMLAESDLSRYKMIYVSGSHVTRQAAEALRRYVQRGGALYTSGWGLARDERNQPLDLLMPVLGLRHRSEPEMYYRVSLYGASRIERWDDPGHQLQPAPAAACMEPGRWLDHRWPVRVGREPLESVPGADVLVRFADGRPAMTRHRYGKGEAFVVGCYPGLEYSANVRREDFNMRRDFDAGLRQLVARPALERTQPVVAAEDPLVEGVLLRHARTGRRAVTLANWAYAAAVARDEARQSRTAGAGVQTCRDLPVVIRQAGPVRRVYSCALDKQLPFTTRDGAITVRVSRLDEGDVFLLDDGSDRNEWNE